LEYVINITAMINRIKRQPRYPEVGMIACHNGVVRGTSCNRQPVSAIEVTADRNRLKEVLAGYKQQPGIVDIIVEIREGRLRVGEDIMAVVVAGNTRENVFPVLQEVVDAIKREVASKTEYFE
jgi:molybdopterin synthase catalytic subunit